MSIDECRLTIEECGLPRLTAAEGFDMWFQYIVVAVIVLLALAAVAYRIYRIAKRKGACDCTSGKSSCPEKKQCEFRGLEQNEGRDLM